MTLIEAVADALQAGALIETPDTPGGRPLRLKWDLVASNLGQEAVVELLAADPGRMDQALSFWVGLNDCMELYRQAMADGDEKGKERLREQLAEDYGWRGPFPDNPTRGPSD